ncbi:uncharacterized protein K489DRAFT_431237 [Dissoconium aciculare CBS 342.82]|uniref:Uncharacterized protein n=1 Tax=Dissoconium aciculare CBS 342.82 TaxID=1314786 RepID=A0A6J3M8I1_9PEZI|nr:uncharacterized protein K489DRAFT_431237 [Dissoconium aciculare CBS 342.82]KAF1823909.1 hypothetical protein K489DRAFT_431237 [Dissoconium aciculare CBS 342.82]
MLSLAAILRTLRPHSNNIERPLWFPSYLRRLSLATATSERHRAQQATQNTPKTHKSCPNQQNRRNDGGTHPTCAERRPPSHDNNNDNSHAQSRRPSAGLNRCPCRRDRRWCAGGYPSFRSDRMVDHRETTQVEGARGQPQATYLNKLTKKRRSAQHDLMELLGNRDAAIGRNLGH